MAASTEKMNQKIEKKQDSTASSSDIEEVKIHKRKCKHSRSSSTCSSSSSSSSPARKSLKKEKKSKRKSHESSTSTNSESDEGYKRKERKKEKKKAKKLKKKMKKEKRKEEKKIKVQKANDEDSADIPIELMERSKAMAPMTKEEWEKRQSVIRRVYDEDTGRHRLIKGDGEVIEEIVSQSRHKEINRQATVGDGNFFQSKIAAKLK